MLQRIQSVYLLIAFGLLVFSLIFPLASFSEGVEMFGYGFIKEGVNLYIPYGVFVIGGLCAFLSFIEIFLYKKRKTQMKIGIANTFLIVFYYITIASYAILVGVDKLGFHYHSIGIAAIIPFIALFFNVLAYLRIKADEKLVRSMDRIR